MRRALLAPSLLLPWLAVAAIAQIQVDASPDVAVDLDGVPVRDREAVLDDLQGGLAIQALALPDGADLVALHEGLGGRVLFAVDTTVALPGGTIARPGDVVRTNGVAYVLDFDASAHGVPDGVQVDAAGPMPSGELLLSFDVSVDLGGVRADDEDVVLFDGTGFALLLDASAEGVNPDLDLDGVAYAGGGRLAVSFDGSGEVGGVFFDDEDVVTLRPGGPDAKLFFDASATHAGWADADLDAVAIPEPGAAQGLTAGAALLAGLARRRRLRMPRR